MARGSSKSDARFDAAQAEKSFEKEQSLLKVTRENQKKWLATGLVPKGVREGDVGWDAFLNFGSARRIPEYHANALALSQYGMRDYYNKHKDKWPTPDYRTLKNYDSDSMAGKRQRIAEAAKTVVDEIWRGRPAEDELVNLGVKKNFEAQVREALELGARSRFIAGENDKVALKTLNDFRDTLQRVETALRGRSDEGKAYDAFLRRGLSEIDNILTKDPDTRTLKLNLK
jgi:hypothetical protein